MRSAPTPNDPWDAREVALRLQKPQSRALEDRLDRTRLPLPHLERKQSTRTQHLQRGRYEAADDVEPVGTAAQRLFGLIEGDLRSESGPIGVSDVRGVGHQEVVGSADDEVGDHELDVEA